MASAIERHELKDEIDEAIRGGTSTRKICDLYGIKHQTTVSRYAAKLRKEDEAKRIKRAEEERRPEFIVDQLQALYGMAARAVRRAGEAGRSTAQVAAQREARATLAMIEKLLEKQRGQATATAGVPAHLVQRTLIDALRPFPEAREAVVEALTKLESEHGARAR